MTASILLCADGSDLSNAALAAGLAIVRPDADVIIATVVSAPDPMLVTGTGMAGGTMSMEDFEDHDRALESEGRVLVADVATKLGVPSAQAVLLRGDAGGAICDFAASQGVQAIVIGSRGRGGIKRALLGSVSDYVVRNAPCPVIITGPER